MKLDKIKFYVGNIVHCCLFSVTQRGSQGKKAQSTSIFTE